MIETNDTADPPPIPADELAIALGGLEDSAKYIGWNNWKCVAALESVVKALVRVREEDAAERDVYRREVARLAKQCDLLVGRVVILEARVGPEGDGR